MSFSKGETVVYGGSGVCEIDDIKDVRFYHERPQKYYILKPLFVNQAQVVYVPCNNEKLTAKIKPVITKKEALELIHNIDDNNVEWVEDRNARKELFNGLLSSGDRKDIIDLISTISARRKQLEDEGKSLNQQDEKILTDAQRRMDAEFAVALGLDVHQIPEFIQEEKAKVS
jgi:CarD family transcriptional regulator